jgi:hypothetical protein
MPRNSRLSVASVSVSSRPPNPWNCPNREPEETSTVPSGSVVFVGYQRRCAISSWGAQVRVSGSNTIEVVMPTSPASVPPVTRTRPEDSALWPVQKTSALGLVTESGVKRVAG